MFTNIIEDITLFNLLLFGLDIYFVWLIFYYILRLIKANVRAIQIVKGLIIIYVLDIISQYFQLDTLNFLVTMVIDWGLLALIIIFQPEIRNGLEQIGRNSVLNRSRNDNLEQDMTSILSRSVEFLAKRRIGALIIIERDVKLDEFVAPSTIIDSRLSHELLTTIFVPTTPLHDGAVIIRNEKLYCAGAYVPSTRREDIDKALGTRHRAAIGISEISDSVTLTVSEETGRYSITYNGELKFYEEIKAFQEDLELYLTVEK